MELIFIPQKHVKAIWPLIRKFVINGIRTSFNDRYTESGVFEYANGGEWHTWVIRDEESNDVYATLFTEIYEELSGLKVGSIRFLSGKNRRDWIGLLPQLEQHMTDAGVQKFEMWARRGWVKDLKSQSYKNTHILFEKDLTDGQVKTTVNDSAESRTEPVRTSARRNQLDPRTGESSSEGEGASAS